MNCAVPGRDTAPGPGSSPLGSTIGSYDGGTQNTLTSVAVCCVPVLMQVPAVEPVSVMVVANGFRKAPLLCCRHCVKFPVVHWASEVQACGGLSYWLETSLSKQKPQNTRGCPAAAPLKEVLVWVPVERANGIGRSPMNVPAGGGQSWLVRAFPSGVQAMPLRVPPVQVPLPQTPTVPPVQRAQVCVPRTEPVR